MPADTVKKQEFEEVGKRMLRWESGAKKILSVAAFWVGLRGAMEDVHRPDWKMLQKYRWGGCSGQDLRGPPAQTGMQDFMFTEMKCKRFIHIFLSKNHLQLWATSGQTPSERTRVEVLSIPKTVPCRHGIREVHVYRDLTVKESDPLLLARTWVIHRQKSWEGSKYHKSREGWDSEFGKQPCYCKISMSVLVWSLVKVYRY